MADPFYCKESPTATHYPGAEGRATWCEWCLAEIVDDSEVPSGTGTATVFRLAGFVWEAALLAAVWNVSRSSEVALIVHPTVFVCDWRDGELKEVAAHHTAVEWQRFRIHTQREENKRRNRATLEVCALALMGYVEGRATYARKLGAVMGDFLTQTLVADHSAPSETEMAGFLMGELDAHPAIAQRAAAKAWKWANPRAHLREVYEAWEGKR